MLKRYLKVFKRKILFLIVLIILIVISSVTKGKTAITTSVIAGILMIAVGIYYIYWILRTPVKKETDEGA